jgi:hypothetical protein
MMRAGVDPSRRLTARAVLEHPWLAQVDAPTKLAAHTTRGVLGWLSDAVSVGMCCGRVHRVLHASISCPP